MMAMLMKKLISIFLLLILQVIFILVFQMATLIMKMKNGKLSLAVTMEENLAFDMEMQVHGYLPVMVDSRIIQNLTKSKVT